MNQAQRLFHSTINPVVEGFARDPFVTETRIALSARYGLGPAILIDLKRAGDRLVACYGPEFTGAVGCASGTTPAELTEALEAEFIPVLDKVSEAKIVMSGKVADSNEFFAPRIATEESPEPRTIREEVGKAMYAAVSATLATVFETSENFAQMSVTATPARHLDPTWVNIHRVEHDGKTIYCAETNDRDFMCGGPPSFYATGSRTELLAGIMAFLCEEYIDAQSVKTVVRGTEELEGDSTDGSLKPRVIEDHPV